MKFPQVKVKLVGEDGNAFSILGRVVSAMRKSGIPKEEIDKYRTEALSGDYDNLLRITMETVDAVSEEDDDAFCEIGGDELQEKEE